MDFVGDCWEDAGQGLAWNRSPVFSLQGWDVERRKLIVISS